MTYTTHSSIIILERRFKVMENITIGNSTYNVFDIQYHGKGIIFSIDGMFSHFVTDTLLNFHNVQFTIIEWRYNPINMMSEVLCSLNAGYPYNPKNNIIEEAILKALSEKRPIYGLAEEIQEDIEEKQWLSQMRYLI